MRTVTRSVVFEFYLCDFHNDVQFDKSRIFIANRTPNKDGRCCVENCYLKSACCVLATVEGTLELNEKV